MQQKYIYDTSKTRLLNSILQQVPKTELITCNLRIFLFSNKYRDIVQKFCPRDNKFMLQRLKSTTATKLSQCSKILLILSDQDLGVIQAKSYPPVRAANNTNKGKLLDVPCRSPLVPSLLLALIYCAWPLPKGECFGISFMFLQFLQV